MKTALAYLGAAAAAAIALRTRLEAHRHANSTLSIVETQAMNIDRLTAVVASHQTSIELLQIATATVAEHLVPSEGGKQP